MNRLLPVHFLYWAALLLSYSVQAQDSYLPEADGYRLARDRYETLAGQLNDDVYTGTGQVNRQLLAEYLVELKANAYGNALSNVDYYNINRQLDNLAGHYTRVVAGVEGSRQKGLYQNTTHLLDLRKGANYLIVDPSLGARLYINKDSASVYSAGIGLQLRAGLGSRLSLAADISYHNERPPFFFADRTSDFQAIPNAGPWRQRGATYSYFLPLVAATYSAVPGHLSITAGYGRNDIGDGMRSLFLSGYSAPMPYVAINTHIWKLHYQNLYLVPEDQKFDYGYSGERGNKFVALHHLSMNVTRWLNIGVFESVTSVRKGHIELSYLNPIIFYRGIERGLGSPDKVALGINAKALLAKRVQLYGQFLLNEFTVKEFFAGRGYVHNKYGAQLGFKYFDAFTIPNLNLQAELNVVRPYTYQHYTAASYSNYNQPLAHPLGAGFKEVLARLQYQPIARLGINARVLYYEQGMDVGFGNVGSNILQNYQQNDGPYGIGMINGSPTYTGSIDGSVAYEVLPNMRLELGAMYRKRVTNKLALRESDDFYFFTGLSYRMQQRRFNQF